MRENGGSEGRSGEVNRRWRNKEKRQFLAFGYIKEMKGVKIWEIRGRKERIFDCKSYEPWCFDKSRRLREERERETTRD
ncbi:hypothetical protein RUM43_008048 [Polyplax serrata]|uniref:Uncharacterized protein n=1 Tax=Polyplax serrata TaxID=468196 RepID=A0AAN8PMZ9_POLSC